MSFYGQSTAYANIPSSSNAHFKAQAYAEKPAFFDAQPNPSGAPAQVFGMTTAANRGQHTHGYPAAQHHNSQEQKHVPLHMRPTAMSYKQYTGPPQHPAQRDRSRSRSPNRGQTQLPPSVIQSHPQPPPNTYVHASAPVSYGTGPPQVYQSPYAGSSSGSGVQPAYQTHFSQPSGQQPNMPQMAREQALRQTIPQTALFLQSIYSPQTQRPLQQTQYNPQMHTRPMSMHIPQQQQQYPHTASIPPQSRPRSATLQSQPALSPQRTLPHPSRFPSSIAGVDISTSPPKPTVQPAPAHAPVPGPVSESDSNKGARRPLPQPGVASAGRPRPMSMPPQAFAQVQSAFSQFQQPPSEQPQRGGGSSISSLQSIIDRPRNSTRPTFQSQPSKTSPSFSAAPLRKAASQSPERKALPTLETSASGLPSSPPSTSAFGVARSSRIDFGLPGINSSPIALPGVLPPAQDHQIPERLPSPHEPPPQVQRRALPQAPSVARNTSQLRQSKGPRPLERKSTVSVTHLISKLNEPDIEQANTSSSSVAPSVVTPASPTKPTSSVIPPVRLPSDPPKAQIVEPQPSLGSDSNDDDDDYVSALDTGDSSHSEQKSPQFGIRDLPARTVALESKEDSSPQHGIRDLPTRDERERGRDTGTRPAWGALRRVQPKALRRDPTESEEGNAMKSPQYGIRDLPLRTKSVLERRKVWERAEPNSNERQNSIRRPVTSTSVGPRAQSSSPTKSSHRSATSEPLPPVQLKDAIARPLTHLSQPQKAPVTPVKSPQPQVPQQTRKYPMPAVQHPKPSRTERTPSWTLPTADLERLASSGGKEPKTSLAMKIASMTLTEEESIANENAGLRGLEERRKPNSVFAHASTRPKPQPTSAPSRTHTTSKSVPSTSGMSRRSVNMDLSLDDAPPAPHRPLSRARSRSPVSASPAIPAISLPGESPPVAQVSVQVPIVNVPDEAPKPKNPPVPVINVAGDDGDDGLPIISISGSEPRTPTASVPAILEDLVKEQSPTKRGLPRPPAISTPSDSSGSSVLTSASSGSTLSNATSGTRSNAQSRGGGLACGGCGEGIVGRIVSAMGLRWHPQCFRCCVCGEHLEHVSSYEHKGKPYCHLDYHEIFAPQCYHCKTPIVDERFITLDDPALGKRTYHEQHFFCAECGDPFLAPSQSSALSKSDSTSDDSKRQGPNINIKGDGAFDIALDADGEEVGFTVFRGHPYCEACHVRLRAPKCKKCKRSIRDGDKAVEALGGKWCFDCFVCAGCERPFEEPSFFQREKKPFCEQCFSVILRNEI